MFYTIQQPPALLNTFFTLAFLFAVGSLGGWILELLFRRFLPPKSGLIQAF